MKLTLHTDLDVARTLNKGNWAILTATVEAFGNGHSAHNVEANECLAEYLDEQDFAYIPLTGFWKGVDQGTSFLVLEIEQDEAVALADRLRQQCIVTSNGLVYTDRNLETVPRVGCINFGKSALKREGYSRTENGLLFSFDFQK